MLEGKQALAPSEACHGKLSSRSEKCRRIFNSSCDKAIRICCADQVGRAAVAAVSKSLQHRSLVASYLKLGGPEGLVSCVPGKFTMKTGRVQGSKCPKIGISEHRHSKTGTQRQHPHSQNKFRDGAIDWFLPCKRANSN